MAVSRKADHEWGTVDNEGILRSCGLILTDEATGTEGITLAAILLFGTDKRLKANQTIVNGIVIKQPREKVEEVVNYCIEPKSAVEILELFDIKSRDYFRKHILNPMVDAGLLRPTIPDKPKSPDQKYVKA